MRAVRTLGSLIILGILLVAELASARAAPPSDWPSLNYDAAASNFNTTEHTLTAHNVLHLKIRWMAPIADVSYPVVADGRVYVPVVWRGRVHIRILDAATGKRLGVSSGDAQGGILVQDGTVWLAGRSLQAIDPANGEQITKTNAAPPIKGGIFLDPIADGTILLAGYASPISQRNGNYLYAVDPASGEMLWKKTSLDAQGIIGVGRVPTEVQSGSVLYDEQSGHQFTNVRNIYSSWFADQTQLYTAASVKGQDTALYAFDRSGHVLWKRIIGPRLVTTGWAHAVSPDGIYVAMLKPHVGVEMLDPRSGDVLWSHNLPGVERMVLANDLLFVLTYDLGQPVRLVVLHAHTGSLLGAIVLSPNYFAFNSLNGLIIADGMVFIRATTPTGSQLIVLGV